MLPHQDQLPASRAAEDDNADASSAEPEDPEDPAVDLFDGLEGRPDRATRMRQVVAKYAGANDSRPRFLNEDLIHPAFHQHYLREIQKLRDLQGGGGSDKWGLNPEENYNQQLAEIYLRDMIEGAKNVASYEGKDERDSQYNLWKGAEQFVGKINDEQMEKRRMIDQLRAVAQAEERRTAWWGAPRPASSSSAATAMQQLEQEYQHLDQMKNDMRAKMVPQAAMNPASVTSQDHQALCSTGTYLLNKYFGWDSELAEDKIDPEFRMCHAAWQRSCLEEETLYEQVNVLKGRLDDARRFQNEACKQNFPWSRAACQSVGASPLWPSVLTRSLEAKDYNATRFLLDRLEEECTPQELRADRERNEEEFKKYCMRFGLGKHKGDVQTEWNEAADRKRQTEKRLADELQSLRKTEGPWGQFRRSVLKCPRRSISEIQSLKQLELDREAFSIATHKRESMLRRQQDRKSKHNIAHTEVTEEFTPDAAASAAGESASTPAPESSSDAYYAQEDALTRIGLHALTDKDVCENLVCQRMQKVGIRNALLIRPRLSKRDDGYRKGPENLLDGLASVQQVVQQPGEPQAQSQPSAPPAPAVVPADASQTLQTHLNWVNFHEFCMQDLKLDLFAEATDGQAKLLKVEAKWKDEVSKAQAAGTFGKLGHTAGELAIKVIDERFKGSDAKLELEKLKALYGENPQESRFFHGWLQRFHQSGGDKAELLHLAATGVVPAAVKKTV